MRYKIVFAYDGTNYLGYAKQPVSTQPSIQETMEDALETIFSEKIVIRASGRTDKNVHALNQVADFDSNKNIEIRVIKRSLNQLTPDDIYIKSVEVVDEDFSSRFSAKSKTYIYVMTTKKEHLFYRNYVQYEDRADIEKMREVLPLFLGKHNFQNFTSKVEDNWNFERTINYFRIVEKDGFYIFEINGDGFMRYMVRKIVGTVLRVGLGKIDASFIKNNLDTKEREIVNFTAQANALFLKEVEY